MQLSVLKCIKISTIAILAFFIFVPLRSSSAATTTTAIASADADNDGVSDSDELNYFHTDPYKADSDGDGFVDGVEIQTGYNPLGPGRAPTSSKRVVVDLSNQTLTYYFNDVAVGTMGVSTGLPIWHTPTGTFAVFAKKPVVNYTGTNYSYPKTKWNLEFYPHVYLHGAYWHNQFGIKPMSHGCVNISYKDVEKLYQFMDIGNQVKVIGKTPSGKVVISSAQ